MINADQIPVAQAIVFDVVECSVVDAEVWVGIPCEQPDDVIVVSWKIVPFFNY